MSGRVLTDQKTASVPSISFGRLEFVPGVLKGDPRFRGSIQPDCLSRPDQRDGHSPDLHCGRVHGEDRYLRGTDGASLLFLIDHGVPE